MSTISGSPLPASLQSLRSVIAKVSGKLPLRTVIIVPFVLQIVGAVGLVGYLSFRNGQKAVQDLASQLMGDVSSRIEQHLDSYLSTPKQINQMNLQAIKSGLLDLKDFKRMGKYFWNQIHVFNFTYINFGTQNGQFIGVGYIDNNVLEIAELSKPNLTKLYSYAPDDQGNRAHLMKIYENNNPNDAAWYTDTVTAGKTRWSPIYNWADFPDQIAISINSPVYDLSNKLIGVIGIDLSISKISKFISTLKVSQSGKVFIVERSGLLVASSSNKPSLKIVKGKAERLKASESSDLLIRATTRELLRRFGSLKAIKSPQRLQIEIEGKQEFIQVTPYQDEFGLDWLSVVAIPEADFMDTINANTRTTILLCIAAFFVAIGVGIITAKWVTKPILSLNTAAKNIAKGEWDKTVKINRSDEMGELAKAFNSMAAQLQTSFAEMKSLNEALSQSESRLNQFLEALPVGVSVHDRQGKVSYLNQTAKRLLGIDIISEITPEKFDSVFQIYRKNQLYPTEDLFTLRALKGETVTLDDIEIHRAGEMIPFEVRSTPIFDDRGTIIYAIAAFQDITERKQAQAVLANYNRTLEKQVAERTLALEQEILERKRAEEAADAANQAKSTFLANMSHELRSPLNAILGFSQLMNRTPNLIPEHKENLGIIMRSGEHLLTLINQILDLSKIEAGRITVNETCFNLIRLLDELEDMFQLKADDKQLQLLFEYYPDLPQYVRTDEVKLRQVLINLLNNAIKFTQYGGVSLRVRLGTRNTEKDFLSSPSSSQLPITTHQSLITFEVEDTGEGIASDELDSLFEAFIQTQTGKESNEGTGLGLAISHQFVKLMGGEITVNSQVGRGTTFRFDIKVSVVDAESIKTHQSPRRAIALEPNQQNYRILIVDDKWSNRQLLKKLLNPLGFEVKEASNGQEAIEVWEAFEPHLIWMDLRMPIMDGYEATKHIKATTKGQSTVVIALTASSLEEERTVALSAGCDDYIRKPFREADIFEAMNKHIGVLYVYTESTSTSNLTQTEALTLTSEALAAFPADWLTNLHQAAIEGDLDLMRTLIAQIAEQNHPLANALADLANKFQFEQLLALTQPSVSEP